MKIFPASRQGFGALAFVLFFVLVIGLAHLAQHHFAGQVADQAMRSSLGTMALSVADAAIEESRDVAARRLDHPGDDGRRLRETLASGRLEVRLEPGDLPRTVELARKLDGDRSTLDGVDLLFLRDPGATLPHPSEYEGILHATASVHSNVLSGVRRKVTRSQGLRQSRLTVSPPLQDLVMMYRRPRSVVSERRVIDDEIQKMADYLPRIRNYLDDFMRTFEGMVRRIQETPEDVRDLDSDYYLEVGQYLVRLYGPMVRPPKDLAGQLVKLSKDVQDLGKYPSSADDFVLLDRSGFVDLDESNIQLHLSMEMTEIEKGARETARKVDELYQATEIDAELHLAMIERLRKLFIVIERALNRVGAFKARYDTVLRSDPRAREFLASFHQVDPVPPDLGTTPSLAALAYTVFDERCAFRIGEDEAGKPDRKTVSQKFLHLLKRLDPRQAGVRATILVDNPTETLTISGEQRGVWTLAVKGALELTGLRRQDPAKDMFTVVAVDSRGGKVRIGGTVEASLVLSGRRLEVEDAIIDGRLLLEDLPGDSIDHFRGRVTRDQRLDSPGAFFQDQVIFSPWLRSRSIERR